MKKFLIFPILVCLMFAAGCETASDLIKNTQPQRENHVQIPVQIPMQTPGVDNSDDETEGIRTTIAVSDIIKMNNDWTMMGECEAKLTDENKKDRILLGTSAKAKNGEMQWDDSQFWTLAVISEEGAYNLLSVRTGGQVYFEYNEAFIQGVSTPVITAYVFGGTDREIRNYTYDKDDGVFVEDIVYTTANFSTGGVNNYYSTFPEYKAK